MPRTAPAAKPVTAPRVATVGPGQSAPGAVAPRKMIAIAGAQATALMPIQRHGCRT